METWQKCPVCNGKGQVFGYTCTLTCHTCNGHGILNIYTGFPPEGIKDFYGTTTTGESLTINCPDNLKV